MTIEPALSRLPEAARAIRKAFGEVVTSSEDFTDTRFYPPKDDDAERVLRYFFFMVAIDHRTSRHKPFEGYVLGEFFHGADMLYRLGILRYHQDPEFFSPERMVRITVEDVRRWLTSPSGATVWDPEVRAELLRDAGRKLLRFYGGSLVGLLEKSEGYIRHPSSLGLSGLFRVFKAYSDPVEKKLFLFVKFSTRRGLLKVVDEHNIEVPVDNHLTRIALRLGIVVVDEALRERISSGVELAEREDVEIRLAVRRAYRAVSQISGIRADYLDDFLWTFGRKFCTRDSPICERTGRCPLSVACPSYGKASRIVEHNFRNTFFY